VEEGVTVIDRVFVVLLLYLAVLIPMGNDEKYGRGRVWISVSYGILAIMWIAAGGFSGTP